MFSCNRSKGFTLIEVMLVLLVIAIITSMVGLRMRSGGEKSLAEEARRINALVRLASEEALLQGRDIGMSIENNGYSFFMFDRLQRQWLSLETERVFRTRTLPRNMRMDIAVEEQDVTWPESTDSTAESDEDETPPPQVLMLSTGEVTPFDLYFQMDNVEAGLQLSQKVDGEREVIRHEFGF